MEKIKSLRLGGKLTRMGTITALENTSIKAVTITKQNDPAHLEAKEIEKIYKLDYNIKVFSETIPDARIITYSSNTGKGEELYYIVSNGIAFHGDPVWSKMHPFATREERTNGVKWELLVTEDINNSTLEGNYLFVGSRNNFTHQLIDCYSLYAWHRLNNKTEHEKLDGLIIGKPNKIINFCKAADHNWAENRIKTISINSSRASRETWSSSITCVKQLKIIKHLSIFAAFESAREGMGISKIIKDLGYNKANAHGILATRSFDSKKIGFLAREDSRIINQKEICSQLRQIGVDIIEDIKSKNATQRVKIISKYDILISPPGSDNINAALFSRDDCLLVYMQTFIPKDTARNPYYTLAGYRYYLPVLHRTLFWLADTKNGMHGGTWATKKLIEMLRSYGIQILRSNEYD